MKYHRANVLQMFKHCFKFIKWQSCILEITFYWLNSHLIYNCKTVFSDFYWLNSHLIYNCKTVFSDC